MRGEHLPGAGAFVRWLHALLFGVGSEEPLKVGFFFAKKSKLFNVSVHFYRNACARGDT